MHGDDTENQSRWEFSRQRGVLRSSLGKNISPNYTCELRKMNLQIVFSDCNRQCYAWSDLKQTHIYVLFIYHLPRCLFKAVYISRLNLCPIVQWGFCMEENLIDGPLSWPLARLLHFPKFHRQLQTKLSKDVIRSCKLDPPQFTPPPAALGL